MEFGCSTFTRACFYSSTAVVLNAALICSDFTTCLQLHPDVTFSNCCPTHNFHPSSGGPARNSTAHSTEAQKQTQHRTKVASTQQPWLRTRRQ